MRRIEPVYADLFLRVQPEFMHTQAYSCVRVSALQFLHAQDPLYVHMKNSAYVGSFLHVHGSRQKP